MMSILVRNCLWPHRWIAFSTCVAASLAVGCSPSTTNPTTDATADQATPEAQAVVVVVNYPLEYFARRIGGDLIQVTFPVPDDQDPVYWEPSGNEIAEIQAADLVLLNGADYAKWTLRATLPWSRTIVTCEGLEEELIEIPDAVVHSHGPEGEHSHAGLVSETWLDPELAIRQARVICDALCDLVPDKKADFEREFLDLQGDLQTLADEVDETLRNISGKWLSAKPRFHYLLARCETAPEVLHWEASETIESAQWESLASRLNGGSGILLWSEPPTTATRERLVDDGVKCVVMDTIARRPKEGDFLSVMRDNLETIRSAFRSHPESTQPNP